ncbi:MAG: D-alanyl-D-alanine carboxypeptidase [Clostridiales bacterium]|nr:D-alanyl-D-alanine carboxypeptidase [Clostridiales bacterium]
MKKFISLILSALVLVVSCFLNANVCFAKDFSGSTAEIVIELNSGRVLHEKNAYEKKYMASTTKILTAITVIENCRIDDVITVTKETVGVEGSSIYLEVGEKLSIKDLLYGLMLRSGNDCAETLAVYCSGSINKFAELMNNIANKIGARYSNFTNPHGLHDENHYTTAYDLALISRYAMNNEIFREIVGKKSVIIPHITQKYDRKLINKNKMLTEFEGANGIKTGYTKKAGRCLVSSCIRDGMELICVVLNCPPMFERSKELLSESFNNYHNVKVVESNNIIGFIKEENNKNSYAIHVKNDIILPLTNEEKENIRIEYNYEKTVKSPLKSDEHVGYIEIYTQNNLIFKEKIYTI